MRLGMWMTSCPEAMGWGFRVIFEKKQSFEIWSWTKVVDFRIWMMPGQLGQRDAPRVVGPDGTVSIVKYCVSLSLCWKPKSQEGNKSFVPELKKVVSVSYAYERFTYLYILRIVIMAILQLYLMA